MSRIASYVAELIGRTPLVRINSLVTTDAYVIAKLEAFNPTSSVKDRIAASIIDATETSGELNPGGIIIGATSGNTGIALAMVDAVCGYRVMIVMPRSVSVERRIIVRVFGAELILTSPKGGVAATVAEAERIHGKRPSSIIASQFDSPTNPAAHIATTDEEIWADTEDQIDIFMAGVGIRGTISGIARSLKTKNPNVTVIAVQPAEPPLLTGGSTGPRGIQGLIPNFLPGNYDASLINEVVSVKTVEALGYAHRAAAKEGLLVGISSGAALVGTTLVATREEFAGKAIMTLLPNTGKRYLSTALFDDLRE